MRVSRALLIVAVLFSVIPTSLTGATPSQPVTLTEVWGFASATAPGGQMWISEFCYEFHFILSQSAGPFVEAVIKSLGLLQYLLFL